VPKSIELVAQLLVWSENLLEEHSLEKQVLFLVELSEFLNVVVQLLYHSFE